MDIKGKTERAERTEKANRGGIGRQVGMKGGRGCVGGR
jgi:hypothetical protein